MDAETQAHVFERFYREGRLRRRSTRAERPARRRLGLAIQIAAVVSRPRQASRVEVESQAGVGTTFRVTLPLAEPG